MILTTEQLSSVTGFLVVAHVIACLGLRFGAWRQRQLLLELTALPAQGLALVPRLLKFKYYFPWVKTPGELQAAPALARAGFHLARLSGLLAFIWLALVFPLSFVAATR